MSIVKKIGKKIIESGFEEVKEAGKEAVEQITGKPRDESGMGEYLKKLDPNLSEEKIKKIQESEAEELKKTREALRSAVPEHMKLPPKQKELRPYERNLEEKEERKKAFVSARQRQEALSLPIIIGKQRGRPGTAKRPRTADFERGKNIKAG